MIYLKANQFDETIAFLADKKSYFNPQTRSSMKQLVSRMELIKTIVEQDDDPQKKHQNSFKPLNGLILSGLEHKNFNVRTQGQKTLIALYQKYGFEPIEPIVSKCSSESIKILVKTIPEAEQYKNQSENAQK